MEKPADFPQIIAEARKRCAARAAATNFEERELVGFCAESIMKLFGQVWPQIAEWLIEESDPSSGSAIKTARPTDEMERWMDALGELAELVAMDVRRRRATTN